MVRADGVDGAIIGEVNKSRFVIYKQMEQEFIATNKKNSITNKFHKNVTTFSTITCRYKLVKQLFVMDYVCCRCGG